MQEERLAEIKKMLQEKKQLTTRAIAQYFNISFDTARRDVLRLTTTGQALRVHGGLIEINRSTVPDFLAREQIQSPIKEKMAQTAKKFVHSGQFDFIGPSTTLRRLCTMVSGMNLQIVTNSIDNALGMINSQLPKVQLLGGELLKNQRLLYSVESLLKLKQLYFDTAFIGASKIRPDGVYTTNIQDAQIINSAVQNSNRIILVAEKYKFIKQNSSPFMSTSLNKIDVVITDVSLDKQWHKLFRKNVQIISTSQEDNHD